MAEPKISVLVADDDRLVGESISLCLTHAGMDVVGLARNGHQTLELTRSLRPRILLLDFRMPGPDASHVLSTVRREHPDLKVIVFSAWNRPDYLARAIIHGADGYLTKEIGLDKLVRAVRRVAGTSNQYTRTIIEAAIDVLSDELSDERLRRESHHFSGDLLTVQEVRILTLMVEGLNNGEIGGLIDLSGNTVKTHVRNILRKLGLEDRTKAAVWAFRNGIPTYLR